MSGRNLFDAVNGAHFNAEPAERAAPVFDVVLFAVGYDGPFWTS